MNKNGIPEEAGAIEIAEKIKKGPNPTPKEFKASKNLPVSTIKGPPQKRNTAMLGANYMAAKVEVPVPVKTLSAQISIEELTQSMLTPQQQRQRAEGNFEPSREDLPKVMTANGFVV